MMNFITWENDDVTLDDQTIDRGKRFIQCGRDLHMLSPGWMVESGICTKSYKKMEEKMSLFPPCNSSCFVSIPQNDLTIREP